MEDEMPKWMLRDHTEEELRNLYNGMPFVNSTMTFKEYKTEWERQRELVKNNQNYIIC